MLVSTTIAEVPKLINYQGSLTDDTGSPVADGDYNMVFTIYDSESGGSGLWYSGIQPVHVENGQFSYLLGSVNPLSQALFEDTARWLGIKVGSDPEIDPRTRLVTVPYAFRVQTLDGAYGGVIYDNVSINEDEPSSANMLTVQAYSGDRAAYFQASGQNCLLSYNNVTTGVPNTYAVQGHAAGGDGQIHGVYGLANGTSEMGIGVLGKAHTNSYYSMGVLGEATSASGPADYHTGVYGRADNANAENTGVFAQATGAGATNYGLYATASGGTTNYSGYFDGDVHITGTLTGGKAGLPAGAIIMWSGDADSIPEGWVLCDGTRGTPDLTDRFILEGGHELSSSSGYIMVYLMKQ
jgi:hypothetical protein